MSRPPSQGGQGKTKSIKEVPTVFLRSGSLTDEQPAGQRFSNASERPVSIRTLFMIGDVCGNAGLLAVQQLLPGIIARIEPDIVIANGENASSGRGITLKETKILFHSGVDVITGGNHSFHREKGPEAYLAHPSRLLRPHNYPTGNPGSGHTLYTTNSGWKIAIINLQCRVFMNAIDCPFQAVDKLIEHYSSLTNSIFIDFHGEASAEKIAMARYVDGRASAVIGTHTHVATADEEIFPGGTAFQCDCGMTGSHAGVIGMDANTAIHRFRTGSGVVSSPSEGDVRLNGVVVKIEDENGKAVSISRLRMLLS